MYEQPTIHIDRPTWQKWSFHSCGVLKLVLFCQKRMFDHAQNCGVRDLDMMLEFVKDARQGLIYLIDAKKKPDHPLSACQARALTMVLMSNMGCPYGYDQAETILQDVQQILDFLKTHIENKTLHRLTLEEIDGHQLNSASNFLNCLTALFRQYLLQAMSCPT